MMNFIKKHLRMAIATVTLALMATGACIMTLSVESPLSIQTQNTAALNSYRENDVHEVSDDPPATAGTTRRPAAATTEAAAEAADTTSSTSTTITTTTATTVTTVTQTSARPTVPHQTQITTHLPTFDPLAEYLPADAAPVPHYAEPSGTAYLTFDDGPSKLTPQILDILAAYHVKATFFVVGHEDAFSREMYRRIAAEGHELAIHTYTHDYSQVYQSVDAYFEDFDRISDLLYSETGMRPTQFRFPGGSSNTVSYKYGGEGLVREIALQAKRRGLTYHDWNVSSGDASGYKQTVEQVLGNVIGPSVSKLEPVVLMHDVPANTATRDALPQMIQQLSAEGYNFDTVSHRSIPCQHRHWEE